MRSRKAQEARILAECQRILEQWYAGAHIETHGYNRETQEVKVSVTLPMPIANVCIQGTLSADPKPASASMATASGAELDRLAEAFGAHPRFPLEPDAAFRARIIAVVGSTTPAAFSPKPARACPECRTTYGHWGWCVGKGYSQTGQHPDAPAPETQRVPQSAEPDYCCGGTCLRELCFIHAGRPKAQAKAERWRIEFYLDGSWRPSKFTGADTHEFESQAEAELEVYRRDRATQNLSYRAVRMG